MSRRDSKVNNIGGFDADLMALGEERQSPLAIERLKKGLCPKCGTTTHKVERTIFGKKKIPLTINGVAVKGKCLLCNPSNGNDPVPAVLEVRNARYGDDATVVSQITLDHRLDGGSDSDVEDSEEFRVKPGQKRPDHTFGDQDEDMSRPEPRRNKPPPPPARRTSASSERRFQSDPPPTARKGFPRVNVGDNDFVVVNSVSNQGRSVEADSPEFESSDVAEPAGKQRKWAMGGRPHSGNLGKLIDEPILTTVVEEVKDHVIEQKQPALNDLDRGAQRKFYATSRDRNESSSSLNAPSITEASGLVDCLNSEFETSNSHKQAMRTLAEIIWEHGEKAKRKFAHLKGLEAVTAAMWSHMGDAGVQTAAAHLLMALSASSDGDVGNDMFLSDTSESAIDALLIVMQTHMTVESIQHFGCATLSCLAAASRSNGKAYDGSYSGAVLSVINAMEIHPTSRDVQEVGLRALFNQCVFSENSERNKRTVASSGIENFNFGGSVICRAMQSAEDDLLTAEWCCRLYWIISSNRELCEHVGMKPDPIQAMLRSVMKFGRRREAKVLLEAAFGAVANLLNVKENYKLFGPKSARLISQMLKLHSQVEGICIEACCLIGNLVSASSGCAQDFVNNGVILEIWRGLTVSPESTDMFEEGVRALLCLSVATKDAKKAICKPAILRGLAVARERHEECVFGQEMFCSLLASLATDLECKSAILNHDGMDAVVAAMKAYPDEIKIQEAGCLAIRNICEDGGDDESYIVIAPAVKLVVHDLQLESPSVLEVACGALWSEIYKSSEGKQKLVELKGLDAISCIIMMHPNETAVVANALGILATVSTLEENAETLEESHCISNVVEVMRMNSYSPVLLEYASLLLKNLLVVRTDRVNEASGAITTILKGMKEHRDVVGLQREACHLVWALTALSDDCKARVLSLDGMEILLGCMDLEYTDVQEAARGAFNQLASNRVVSLT